MFLAIDIGGTKTLLAVFDISGTIVNKVKFPTSQNYKTFINDLKLHIDNLGIKDFKVGAAAIPGLVDRENENGIAFGNLPWKNVPIQADIENIINAPVLVENDTRVAGLSEAKLIKDEFNNVLYVTISTGISSGLIVKGVIEPNFDDSESGHMLLEHKGKLQKWESFASGKAILKKYGKQISDITDQETLRSIARNIAYGLINLIAVIQPDVIILGGGVGAHFDKFKTALVAELKKHEMPLVPIPPVRGAKRAEEAVIYGCYELVKQHYGRTSK